MIAVARVGGGTKRAVVLSLMTTRLVRTVVVMQAAILCGCVTGDRPRNDTRLSPISVDSAPSVAAEPAKPQHENSPQTAPALQVPESWQASEEAFVPPKGLRPTPQLERPTPSPEPIPSGPSPQREKPELRIPG